MTRIRNQPPVHRIVQCTMYTPSHHTFIASHMNALSKWRFRWENMKRMKYYWIIFWGNLLWTKSLLARIMTLTRFAHVQALQTLQTLHLGTCAPGQTLHLCRSGLALQCKTVTHSACATTWGKNVTKMAKTLSTVLYILILFSGYMSIILHFKWRILAESILA